MALNYVGPPFTVVESLKIYATDDKIMSETFKVSAPMVNTRCTTGKTSIMILFN